MTDCHALLFGRERVKAQREVMVLINSAEYQRKEQAMEDEKKVNYMTKEDFMNQVGVIWMFIMLTLIAILWDRQVFQIILFSVSFLMFVLYMGYSRVLIRRKRRGMG